MKGLYKMHDLLMDIKRERCLGHVIRMDKIKVIKKREICVFWDTTPRGLIAVEVSEKPVTAIIKAIREEHDTPSPSHFTTDGRFRFVAKEQPL
jgi:hypothetical protein